MDAHITLSPETRKQTSTIHKMLVWMQNHEGQLNNTNIKHIARTMVLSDEMSGHKESSLCERMNYMLNNQMVYRYGGKRRANFRINYLHKDIPPDVLDGAPKSVQLDVKRTLKGISEGQYLDDVGCIVTPAKPEEPKEVESTDTPVSEAPAKPAETNQEIAVPVKVERDGRSINITVTINLN